MLYLLLSIVQSIVDPTAENAEHITETPITTIASMAALKQHAKVANVEEHGSVLALRGLDGTNSFITLSRGNQLSNWAVEYTVRRMHPTGSQKAGTYFWYTQDELRQGLFKGAAASFVGLVAGLEFVAGRTHIVFGFNYDGKEFTEADLRHDRVPESALAGVDEITVKVVHTINNFIVELYEGDRLISDSFRINGSFLHSKDGKELRLGFTSDYENWSEGVVELAGIRVLEREEGEDYSPHVTHTELNSFERTESGDEVLHTIANLKHLMTYLDLVLANEGRNEIEEIILDAREEGRRHQAQLEKATTMLEEARTAGRSADWAGKLKEMEGRIEEMRSVLDGMKRKLKATKGDTHGGLGASRLLMGFMGLAAVVVLIKQLVLRYSGLGKELKKNN